MTKVNKPQGGDRLVVEDGGTIVVGTVTISTDGDGNLIFTGLPTSDPSVAGALWANAGVVTVSAG